jgi:UDP-glucose 4-epimerase
VFVDRAAKDSVAADRCVERDGAQAVRKALEYDVSGMEIFIIANADTVMATISSAELAARVHPYVPVRHELGQFETLLSIDKPRRLLGYEPEHNWRDQLPAVEESN